MNDLSTSCLPADIISVRVGGQLRGMVTYSTCRLSEEFV